MSESASSKKCMLCGKDCSAIPRVKDAQGHYSCKACFEAATAKKAAKAQDIPPSRKTAAPSQPAKPAAQRPAPVAAAPATEDDAAMMAALFDSPAAQAAEVADPCPECGAPSPATQQVCLHCGYNRQTGKKMKMKVSRETGAAAATAKVGKALILANPLVWAVGGVIGGTIGAALWAIVAVVTHREIGWIAWGVGVLTGVGVRVVAGRYAGFISGVVAAVIAVVAVLGGKFATASFLVEEFAHKGQTAQSSTQASPQSSGKPEPSEAIKITDDDIQLSMASEVAGRMQNDGLNMYWPKGKNADNAEHLYDYPQDVRDEVSRTWRKATPDWKAKKRAEMEADEKELRETLKTAIIENKEAATEAVFTHSFGPLDIVFLIFAVASAFAAGSGAGGGDDGED